MSAPVLGSTRKPFNDGDHHNHKKKGAGALATAYLVIYNVIMTAGYEHISNPSTLKSTSWSVQHSECTGCRECASFYTTSVSLCNKLSVHNEQKSWVWSIKPSDNGSVRKSSLLVYSVLVSTGSCVCTQMVKLLSRQNGSLFLSPHVCISECCFLLQDRVRSFNVNAALWLSTWNKWGYKTLADLQNLCYHSQTALVTFLHNTHGLEMSSKCKSDFVNIATGSYRWKCRAKPNCVSKKEGKKGINVHLQHPHEIICIVEMCGIRLFSYFVEPRTTATPAATT